MEEDVRRLRECICSLKAEVQRIKEGTLAALYRLYEKDGSFDEVLRDFAATMGLPPPTKE